VLLRGGDDSAVVVGDSRAQGALLTKKGCE
jgi:hypothetical protein